MIENKILEADQRLSRSLLWERQRSYFLRTGMAAWQQDVVPHAVSCSPLLARAYSDIACGYLQDCVEHGWVDTQEPIYIIELGAGSGRLSHHFLHHFVERCAGLTVKLILTDFAPRIVDAWRDNTHLHEWVKAGVLDFAVFDAEDPQPLHLQVANQTLTHTRNPLLLLANYFFDSIPHDSFAVAEGMLCENLLTLRGVNTEDEAAFWEQLTLSYEAFPLSRAAYAEPRYEQVLNEYEQNFPEVTFSFPNVGLDCLRFWEQFSGGKMALLTADRGYSLADSVLGQADPLLNLHGSFSMMVNYHAIGRFFTLSDGLTLQTPHYQNQIQIGAYFLGQQEFPSATDAFTHAVVRHDPNDFFALRDLLNVEELTLPHLLSILRMSAWDADLFEEAYPALQDQIGDYPEWFEDVVMALAAVEAHYLPLGEGEPVSAMFEHLRTAMRDYTK